MKEQKHIWEADVRQQVTGHIFEYDPADWNDMEQLLDQAGTPPPDSNPPPSPGAENPGFWKTGFFTLLAVGVLLVWYFLNSLNPDGSDPTGRQMSAFPIQTIENRANQLATESSKEVPAVAPDVVPKEKPLGNSKKNINQGTVPAEKLEMPEELPENRGEEELESPKRETIELLTPLPRSSDIPLLKTFPRPLDFEIPVLKRPRRKRDRRKLYPDVFDNY